MCLENPAIKGNSKGQSSKSLDGLIDQDLASILWQRIMGWVRAESKESSSNHFGIREPEEIMADVK